MIPSDGYIQFKMVLMSHHLRALNFWAINYLIAREAYADVHQFPEALIGGIPYALDDVDCVWL